MPSEASEDMQGTRGNDPPPCTPWGNPGEFFSAAPSARSHWSTVVLLSYEALAPAPHPRPAHLRNDPKGTATLKPVVTLPCVRLTLRILRLVPKTPRSTVCIYCILYTMLLLVYRKLWIVIPDLQINTTRSTIRKLTALYQPWYALLYPQYVAPAPAPQRLLKAGGSRSR